MPDMNRILATHDLVWLTLDTLRYDVAVAEMDAGRTPTLARLFPQGWQKCHTPGSFTYAAHAAFFVGFLPTPADNPKQPRFFAMDFHGATTKNRDTAVFEAPDLITGLRAAGRRTFCIGGVGFFNQATPLGQVFPSLFDEAYWEPAFGVTDPRSSEHQFAKAIQCIETTAPNQPYLMFINVSALHQPNCFYLKGAEEDSLASHAAALRYVDQSLASFVAFLLNRPRPVFFLICSDHGTSYGEGGFVGHRAAHECIWTVPLAYRSSTEMTP
ncbi:STM4013/SEN3800 family hydrolase [Acanthopleuribacter pedis]|uniref:STM4013/SEN3800 family hydrolase n=1 Tax=Acanthopleuribacter pedis TaxID=442870 RepID=A0A8J7QE98_9BACT|nr:STM4013/SEN3800 family hydrolase [Acanthopleuribacter pedis]MBO1322614.1 STM4013/SEN3800 family hydrolase [Acanthopleuribacter pedis]